MFASLNRALDESRPFENLHMLRDAVERNREAAGQTPDVDVAACEHREDRAAGRIGNSTIDSVQGLRSGGGCPSTIVE